MNSIHVVDNVFPDWLLKTIQHSISNLKEWEYGRVQSAFNEEYENYYNCVLWHKNYPEAKDPLKGLTNTIASCFALEVLPKVVKSATQSLQIARLNGTTPASTQYPHRDCDMGENIDNMYSIVWYPFDSDGGLRFWEDQIVLDKPSQVVEYKINRAVVFPSHIPHAGLAPTDWPMRVSINTVWALN